MDRKISSTEKLMMCGLAVALNIVLGIVAAAIKSPVYLDTLGTIFIAIYFGPWYGAAVGAATNFLTALLYGMQDMPGRLKPPSWVRAKQGQQTESKKKIS